MYVYIPICAHFKLNTQSSEMSLGTATHTHPFQEKRLAGLSVEFTIQTFPSIRNNPEVVQSWFKSVKKTQAQAQQQALLHFFRAVSNPLKIDNAQLEKSKPPHSTSKCCNFLPLNWQKATKEHLSALPNFSVRWSCVAEGKIDGHILTELRL